ncbi:MAG: transcription termination factor NusA [Endozoicomonadaceae bacterium]|nr:transcription termination factor NusA [Endozoicomonadaceae bacterium]
MGKEILQVVDSVSNEKGIAPEVIVEAIESALATATKKRYKTEVDIRVSVDRKTGNYDTFRCWTVVADEDFEIPGAHLTLDEAHEHDKSLKIGDVWEEQVESIEFKRVAAQTAKHVIIQKVREAKRHQMIEQYRDKIGTLITGMIKKVMREFYIIDLGGDAEAILPKNQTIPRENFRTGVRIRALLQEVEQQEGKGPQLILSRTNPKMLAELFRLEVPEITEEIIEIKAVARDPGSRAKIAVKTNDGRIDPVGACVGMRGARVQAISSELQNERVDIVLWNENPAQFVINSMQPAEVASIVVDEDKHVMDIAVHKSNLAQAIGRGGQNVRLASDLTNWVLNVMTTEEAQNKQLKEVDDQSAELTEALEIDKELAIKLIEANITTVEEVAYLPKEEILSSGVLDEKEISTLQQKAKEALLKQEETKKSDNIESNSVKSLFELKDVDPDLITSLLANNINDLEVLAEQAVDDLVHIEGLTMESAGKLIMQARNICWFGKEE